MINDQPDTREWIETNGLGGYSSSTVSAGNTRGYHGLLVAQHGATLERFVLVSQLFESLNGTELATCFFSDVVNPKGFQYLESFSRIPAPTWRFKVEGILLERTVLLLAKENTVLVRYTASENSQLILRPFFANRSYHSVRSSGNPQIISEELSTQTSFSSQVKFNQSEEYYYNFTYPKEIERGLQAREDLETPGCYQIQLTANLPFFIAFHLNPLTELNLEKIFNSELERRKTEENSQPLSQSAASFVISRPNGSPTILAGYHWFTDWGRDTMISLPGCLLVSKRFAEARKLLETYSNYLKRGLLPNRFPDSASELEYNSVDAPLWFVVAAYKYLKASGDLEFKNLIHPKIKEVIDCYKSGTDYSIFEGQDGLIYAGTPQTNLTWMDARVNQVPITPRNGAAVEIQALWYNAQKIFYEEFCEETADSAEKTRESFIEKFTLEDLTLCDYICDGKQNKQFRPNQILALSLPFSLVEQASAKKILVKISEELLTPYGLRSLSPRDPAYRSHYLGDPQTRDASYHQGTVWGWLLGPYIMACKKFAPELSPDLAPLIKQLEEHGALQEIYDGNFPHTARGSYSQAWSVAAVVEAE